MTFTNYLLYGNTYTKIFGGSEKKEGNYYGNVMVHLRRYPVPS